jgi:undecaprenyl-diphosphatase
VALAVLAILDWLALLPMVHRWDESVTIWLQRAAPAPDWVAAILVYLGNAEVVIPAVALVGGLFLRRNPKSGMAFLWLAAVLIAASLLAVILKHLILHLGPPEAFHRRHIPGLHVGTPYSFPSGHTLRTTVLCGTVLRNTPWLAGALILCMMAALVYMGDHWLSDVIGGLCLGWVLLEAGEVLRKARSRSCHRG